VSGVSGLFVEELHPRAFADAMRDCRDTTWDGERLEAQAERFSRSRFDDALREVVRAAGQAGPRGPSS
jgi:hypothetical protein